MDDYINELIEIRKPIIAAVDGAAIGIGCSTLGLFDSIIASSRAEFLVPFSKIALVPEGILNFFLIPNKLLNYVLLILL